MILLKKQPFRYLLILFVFVLFVPIFGFAQENTFTPLVGIPGVNPNTQQLSGYIEALYLLSISLAALLAFLKIILAGVQYMMTDVVSTKGEAKKTIEGALLGLLIIIGAVIILETINPTLTNLNALDTLEKINVGGDNGPTRSGELNDVLLGGRNGIEIINSGRTKPVDAKEFNERKNEECKKSSGTYVSIITSSGEYVWNCYQNNGPRSTPSSNPPPTQNDSDSDTFNEASA